ncbi:MAG: amidohydrolase family protein, partial [Planctomycetota bacterium]
VTCKLSGMVTEADPSDWTVDRLRPYAEVVLEAFGPPRLMFGSDWPVCLVGTSYPGWRQTVGMLIDDLSDHEQSDILGGTAARAYNL